MRGVVATKKQDAFILFLGLTGLTVLFSAFVLTLTGVIDITYINSMQVKPIFEFLGNSLLFMGNIYFVCAITLQVFDRSIWKITLYYLPVYLVSLWIPTSQGLIATVALPHLYCLVIAAVKQKNIKQVLGMTLLFISVILPYQWISGFIKLWVFSINYQYTSVITTALFSIDLYLVLIFFRWVVKNYEVLGKLRIPCKNQCVPDACQFSETDVTQDLNRRQKILFYILAAGFQFFQLAVVLLIGKINHTFIELIVMLCVFWIGRTILKQCWHSEKLWICSACTFASFYILTKCTLPLSISLFTNIALSGAFTYMLSILAIKTEEYQNLKRWFTPEEEFRKQCIDAGLSKDLTETATGWLYHKMRDKELMTAFDISSVNTLNSRKRRIKQALHIK